MQKLINKNLDLRNALPLISYLKEKGCNVTASFIFGFPEETEEDLCQTMHLIAQLLKLHTVSVQTHLCTFLPGTEMSRIYRSDLTPATDYSDITGTTALDFCADLVQAHPDLFLQFREYKTELRSELRDFRMFFKLWAAMQPVYQYFSEHYDEDRLVDMYFDFVRDNRQILDETQEQGVWSRVNKVIAQDRFARRFDDSEYAQVVRDYYRMSTMKSSRELQETGVAMDMYCFSPLETGRGTRLQDYRQGRVLAVYTRDRDGNIKISVQKGF
jgi:hypothetical protein